jgi:hypothetical protein
MEEFQSECQVGEDLSLQGLIISFEGLANPIIESQILEHADELMRNGAKTEVWFLCGTRRLYKENKAHLEVLQAKHYTRIRLLRSAWHNLPLSEYLNAIIVNASLNRLGFCPNWIHARTEYVGAVCAALKYFRAFRFILDLRGNTFAEILLQTKNRSFVYKTFLKIKLHTEHRRLIKSRRKADAAVFVSKELQR